MRFRAMGTDALVVAAGARPGSTGWIASEIARLERLWSRFDPRSEIAQLNRARGRPVAVSPETIALVGRAVEAWELTGGLFDPTILSALEAVGYDRSFEHLLAGAPRSRSPAPAVAGCSGIVIDAETREITLPSSAAFDPGGIGKGLAGDLICDRVMSDGSAKGLCIDLGGDVRLAGHAPDFGPWVVGVEHPYTGAQVGKIPIWEGAVTTTTHTRRRWVQGDRARHHVIDPRTGLPAWTGIASVTVVAGEGWWAEALSKAAFLAGADRAPEMLDALGIAAAIVRDDGSLHGIGAMERWLS